MSSSGDIIKSALTVGAGVAISAGAVAAHYLYNKDAENGKTAGVGPALPIEELPKAVDGLTHVLVVGGGNGAHVLAGLIGSVPGVQCNLFDSWADEAERIEQGQKENGCLKVVRNFDGVDASIEGKLGSISKQASEVVPGSNVILICVPAFTHEPYLKAMKDYISPGTILGAMPAQGGFSECVYDCLGKELASTCVIFGLETLPWACRLKEFGKVVEVLGTKGEVDIAIQGCTPNTPTVQRYVRDVLQHLIGPLPALKIKGVLLGATLMNINQIWHPTISFGKYRDWDGKPFPEPPLFYEGVDDYTAGMLSDMSDEVLTLKAFLLEKYPLLDLSMVRHVKDWMFASYENDIKDKTNLMTAINSNTGYKGLTHPCKAVKENEGTPEEKVVGYVPDTSYRYFTEDCPCGLLVTRGVAELAGVPTPKIDMVINWVQTMLGKEYLVDGKLQGKDIARTRTPQRYGYTDLVTYMEGNGWA